VKRLCRLGGSYLAAGLLLSSCGGGGTPAGPSGSGGGNSGGNASITITMTSAGVSPKQLTVSQGTRVLFTNSDTRTREMTSDPHPEHTDCVEINNVGFINPGQTKETGNLNTVKTCGYHDHGNPDDARFKGQIIIK
jgi:plastocyanin